MTGPASGLPSGLAGALYADLKAAIVGSVRALSRLVADANREHFTDIRQLRDALATGRLRNGQRITLYCKPAAFGPFMRSHFLTPFIGNRPDLRLGPPLLGSNPWLGFVAQLTSHYMPVGLFPPVAEGVVQATLYPADAEACGMIGLVPGVSDLVPTLPALFRTEQMRYYGLPCMLQGAARLLDAADYAASGIPVEAYEAHRQQGGLWFIDATQESEDWRLPSGDAVQPLWGGLYASGHLELAAPQNLTIAEVVTVIAESAKMYGFDTSVVRNEAGPKEVSVFGRGFRSVVSSQAPVYSFHMDAELSAGYQASRTKFDGIARSVLEGLRSLAEAKGAGLSNPLDLDFSYTDSTSAFKVLRSMEADAIADPVAIVVREWHRRRSPRSAE